VRPSVNQTPHILIADGDPDTRSLYHEALAHLATIDEAADGAEAVAKALRRPPTLVITEIRLPHLDGYALCATLRADETTRETGILVVTASLFEPAVGHPADNGADGVLLKPCAIDLLRARVDDFLRQRRARGVRAEAGPTRPVSRPVRSAYRLCLPSCLTRTGIDR
jgi:DNA-binding response OmpR family regulator